MTFNSKNCRAFAQAELRSFDLSEYDINENLVLNSLEKDIENSILSLNTDKVKTQRSNLFKIDGAEPANYQEHVLNLNNGEAVICGIRHMNLNREIPFVNLRPSFEIKDKKQALNLYKEISQNFSVFNPKYLCFHSANSIKVDRLGCLYMAAKTQQVVSLDKWPKQDRLDFIRVDTEDYYQWYESEYKRFHQLRVDLSQAVTLNSKEIMNTSMKEGLLYNVYCNEKQIGLIAGERADFMGKKALYFNDIVVSSDFKGEGFAKAMQKKFIEMNQEEFELVFGTIDFSNKPSLNTAKANARKAIRFENFIEI